MIFPYNHKDTTPLLLRRLKRAERFFLGGVMNFYYAVSIKISSPGNGKCEKGGLSA